MVYNNPQYDSMLHEWNKMDDATASQDLIHRRGETYLPRLSKMSDDQYDAYVERASFVTLTKRTIEAFTGMVMRKPVEVDGITIENIDAKGGNLNSYIEGVLSEYLKKGRGGTLVDVPVAGEEVVSIADAKNNNIYPRLIRYETEDIVNWKTEIINNIEVLSLVVLREKVDVATNEFEHNYQYRYRALDVLSGQYQQRLFDDQWNLVEGPVVPLRKNKPLDFIPFIIHGGIKVDYPPLLNIADQNVKLYQLDADYKHGLHFVALPTPYITGVDAEDENLPNEIGPTKLWKLPEGASAGMLEFTGAGLGQIRKAMDDTMNVIVVMASKILSPEKSSNDESALAAVIRSNAETSSLAGIVNKLSIEMEKALKVLAWWNGDAVDNVKIKINIDFLPSTMSGADIISYVTSWLRGGISYDSLFNVLKTGEVVRGDRLIEDELSDIEKEQNHRMELNERYNNKGTSPGDGEQGSGRSSDEEPGTAGEN